ncbi:MAG: hypothetical protein JWR88_1039 [Pseudonocardia sp.]|nr:hypothetical protein [Pseudonocardia sp.]
MTDQQPPTEPTFALGDDGEHFWWTHDCVPPYSGVEPGPTTTLMPHAGGTWRVVQAEPLTVSPSIHCLGCGTHGFIRDGQWVPA